MPINAHDAFSSSLPLAWNFAKLYVRDVLLYLAFVGGLGHNENKEKATVNNNKARSFISSFLADQQLQVFFQRFLSTFSNRSMLR